MKPVAPPRVAIPLTLSRLRRPDGAARALGGDSMGTSWSVKFVGAAPTDVLRAAIDAALDRVVRQMSPWLAESELNRFNAQPAERWQTLEPEFAAVMSCALRIAQQTDGAFDPTIGALVDLWGFGASEGAPALPAGESLAGARCGWRHLEHDATGQRLRRRSEVRLDLCGIAKGFAVDLLQSTLRDHGVDHALVEIGGELSGAGIKPDGTPWWVAIDRPRGSLPSGVAAPWRVALHGLSIATSGCERGFDVGGRRYSHSIDPRSREPIDNGMITASVLHPSCMDADAYATALMVMGPERGLAFAAAHDLAAVLLSRTAGGDVDERVSPALAAMLD